MGKKLLLFLMTAVYTLERPELLAINSQESQEKLPPEWQVVPGEGKFAG